MVSQGEHLRRVSEGDPDAVLYNALSASEDFDVLLAPVVLHQASDWDGEMVTHSAYRFDDVGIATDERTPLKKKKISKEFHIPKLSAIQKISSQECTSRIQRNEADAVCISILWWRHVRSSQSPVKKSQNLF